MLTRTISGFFLIVILFALLYFGGYVLLAALLLFSLIGLYEYHKAISAEHRPFVWLSYIACVGYYAILFFRPEAVVEQPYGFLFLIVFFLVLMIAAVFTYPERRFEDAFLTFCGTVYVAVLFSFLFFVRRRDHGFTYVWFIFWAAWGSDTFAYLCGRAFGKHKLVPKLSPNKTIEGAVGGVIGATVLCVVYGMLVRGQLGMDTAQILMLAIPVGLCGAVLGQTGDLFSSAIKRFMDIKDFGHLIPGHGGILDRFDSILLSGTVVALVLMLI
ncbi:MAG: phosphatidate cytidylyltransferase [Clostridiales bacterium]|nr:phosphatidate cytidylyltransferase [Clostridiales bacterium]